MSILAIWCILALLTGIAANARGRSGVIWFVIALLISPLIALILVFALRNIRQEDLLQARNEPRRIKAPTYLNPTRTIAADAPPRARWFGHASRVNVDRTPKPFEPDGLYAGIPYRVTDAGLIEALMQGAVVRFATMEKFTEMVGPG